MFSLSFHWSALASYTSRSQQSGREATSQKHDSTKPFSGNEYENCKLNCILTPTWPNAGFLDRAGALPAVLPGAAEGVKLICVTSTIWYEPSD